ncbi:MAG: PAS domain S-box protein [Methanocalculus sp.]|uniref:PAS domain S-box protein n=1 Tax=Methanocalculus sp. TaxID=2004547 RepID=UPI0027271510|nr:PAS domain S-box protein [Methanocalculus sp.]MDO9539353.1 PAS domain S-box protein [Methanocalculus sp.]
MNGHPVSYLTFFADKTDYLVYRLRITLSGLPEVLYISGSVRSILGYDPGAFYQDPSLLQRIIHPQDHGFFLELQLRGEDRLYLLHLIRNDGVVRTLEISNAVFVDQKTGDLIVEGVGRDVTDVKLAEEALIRETIVIQTLPNAFVTYDAGGRITGWNPGAEEMSGFSRGEVIGSKQGFVLPADQRDEIADEIRSGFLKGEVVSREVTFIRKDGEERTAYSIAIPLITPDGEFTGSIGIAHDITREKLRERDISSRDRILEAVGYAASGFLSAGLWKDHISGVVRRFGEAADASRAFFYRIDEEGAEAIRLVEWIADGGASGYPETLDCAVYGEGYSLLLSGSVIHGVVGELGPLGELARKVSPDLRSILIVPIAVHGVISAFIGFDECRYDRVWSPSEVKAFEIAGRIIGAAMEREADHQALIESENRFRSIFEGGPLGMVIAGPNQQIILVNPAFERMIGCSQDELVGSTFRDITHPDDIPENERGIADLISGKIPVYTIEKRYLRRGGGILHAQTDLAPIPLPDGRGYIAMIEDITRRKSAESKLRESEEIHRSFLQHFQGIVYRSVEGESVFIHGAVGEITGYQPEEIRSGEVAWSSLIHPADREEILRRYDTLYATPGDRFNADYRIIRRDGVQRWVNEAIQHRISEDGRSIIEAAISDITRRHEVEELLSRSNAKLNLLQSITRHDILNQVMTISAYTELIKDLIHDPMASEYVSGMEATIERIHRISAFTRDYQDVGVKGPIWQDLHTVIARGFINRSPNQITLNNLVEDYEIFADPLLERVFYNLVDNSRKYGGKRISCIRASCREEEGELRVVVEDDGIGIDSSILGRIFSYGAGKGTGLGLFLIREILSITGVTIEVCPADLGGAGFMIRVPPGRWRKGIYNTPPAS